MKKGLLSLAVIFAFFFAFDNVNAASVSVSAPKTAVVGNTFTVNVTVNGAAGWQFCVGYDSNKLRADSSSANGMCVADQKYAHSNTYTYKFRALSSGTANIKISDMMLVDDNENRISNSSAGSATVSIKTQAEIEASYSKNNNLASLSVEGATLSPAFNQNTTEYKVELEPDVTSINVSASAADAKATITGTGQREVTEGDNNIEVKVTAENGSVKTYTIKATVKEYDPIKVKIKGKEYTVVRKKSMLPELNGYTETTVKINGTEIPALKSDITGYTLVALKDSKGNQNYYVKDKDNYTLYKEYTFGKVVLCPLPWNKSDIPKNYKKMSIAFNDEKIDAYKLKIASKYALIYGMNVETGEKHIYMYDSNEDTLQIYNDEELKLIKKQSNLYLKLALGLAILSFVLVIVVITTLRKNRVKVRMMNR